MNGRRDLESNTGVRERGHRNRRMGGTFPSQPADIQREPLIGNLDSDFLKTLVDRGEGMATREGRADLGPGPTDLTHLGGGFLCAKCAQAGQGIFMRVHSFRHRVHRIPHSQRHVHRSPHFSAHSPHSAPQKAAKTW